MKLYINLHFVNKLAIFLEQYLKICYYILVVLSTELRNPAIQFYKKEEIFYGKVLSQLRNAV